MKKNKKAILIIIDGWGVRKEKEWNAIAQALTPTYSHLLGQYPNGLLEASGIRVGLPEGVMGNSEVGHMNIGSGRPVIQNQVRIHDSIHDGSFFKNSVLLQALEKVKKGKSSKLHLLGLVSQGNVHSAERHYFSLLAMIKREQVPSNRVFVHAFLDGRDTLPKSAQTYLESLEEALKKEGGRVASISGRFYAMDRDKRWDRTDLAYRAMVLGDGHKAMSARDALEAAYQRRETDEFVLPTAIVDPKGNPLATIESGDVVICFNFRPDRMRQIVQALTNHEANHATPIPSLQKELNISCYCFTQYDKTFDLPVVFHPQDLSMCLGELISQKKLHQFRIAETEKYAHVTYFFNGGREMPFELEDRCLIPSPKVKTYDLVPEMSSKEVTQAVVERAKMNQDTLIVVNYAQPDMVGHTGNFEASVAAVEATDRGIREIAEVGQDHGFYLFITADHGNVEMMKDPKTGQPHTAHTTNPVPLICVGKDLKKFRVRPNGALCDIVPTMLFALGMEKPSQMTGENLLIF